MGFPTECFPTGLGIVDTMIDFPWMDKRATYEFLQGQLRDRESTEEFEFPVEYIFKQVPGALAEGADPVHETLTRMDRFGIEWGMCGSTSEAQRRALIEHPDRFVGSMAADPHAGRAGLDAIRRAVETIDLRAVVTFPAGCDPQVPLNDARWFPIYGLCQDLGLPVFVCVGVPGPRVPMLAQKVELLDEVCWNFPDLTIVMRHGAEPWAELAVKLMLKWPNLHYSTSAFAPRYYPSPVIEYANTRGASKVLYAGYYPMGLTLERIFNDLPGVPLHDEVWPAFLSGNARRILRLPDGAGRSSR